MELIKKVFNYLLHNPLYAVVIAVCYVAITVVVVLLRAKSSKPKTAQVTQPVEQKKSEETKIDETNNVVSKESPAPVTPEKVEPVKDSEPSKPVTEEKVREEVKAVSQSQQKETVQTTEKKATKPKAKKETATPKKETPATNVEKETEKPVSAPKKKTTSSTKSTPVQEQAEVKAASPAPVKEEPKTVETVSVTKEKTVKTQPQKKTRYNGKWVIWRLLTKINDENQESEETFFFELLASNGEKLLSSEEYLSLAGAQKGIQTHKANILKNNFRISLTKKGDYIFKLLNGKNGLLCTGENYPTKLRCENAIESTKRFAETAIIDENIQDLIVQVPTEDIDDSVAEPDNGYNGKWIVSSMISPDGNPIYYFELFASNGEKLLTSEEYITYNGVINGINTHKNNIEKNNFRISLTKRGDYIFKILNANEQLLCLGEHYKTRSRCERAVESVKRFAKTAQIMDSPSVRNPIAINN